MHIIFQVLSAIVYTMQIEAISHIFYVVLETKDNISISFIKFYISINIQIKSSSVIER